MLERRCVRAYKAEYTDTRLDRVSIAQGLDWQAFGPIICYKCIQRSRRFEKCISAKVMGSYGPSENLREEVGPKIRTGNISISVGR